MEKQCFQVYLFALTKKKKKNEAYSNKKKKKIIEEISSLYFCQNIL